MGIVGASVLLGLETSLLPDSPPSVESLLRSSFSSLVTSPHAWTVAAALATCVMCLVSDLRVGSSRSAYKTRCAVVKEPAESACSYGKEAPEAIVVYVAWVLFL